MRSKLTSWWFDWQQSLWFFPAILTVSATLLALALVRLDQSLELEASGSYTWAFGGGAEGARGVLQAIAGSMISVTGTVFSITIVALQLASSQFSPRVLRTFMSDRGVQLVLGIFVGTFTYCLLVLRSVRSELESGPAFVPSVSVTVGVGLALLCIGCLIFYIHHVARAIQVATVAERVAQDTHGLIDLVFKDTTPARDDSQGKLRREIDSVLSTPGVSVSALTSGYLERIDTSTIFTSDDGYPVTIHSLPCVGDFVLSGTTLATVWPVAAVTDERISAIRAAHILGLERTLAEDVDFGLRQLADMAVKALSPGINDPTTATDCIDRLGELIGQIVRLHTPSPVQTRENSTVSFVSTPRTVAQLIDTAFTQVRIYAVADAIVMSHLCSLLGRLAAVSLPIHRPILIDHAHDIIAAVDNQDYLPTDRRRVESSARWIDEFSDTQ